MLLALAAGKTVLAALRLLRLGGGTAAPGLIASSLDPAILAKLASSLPHGSIIVSGTNGKTTTTRLLAEMLQRSGMTPLHNRSGSNMMRGMTSAAIAAASWRGRLAADAGLWEVDEATLPDAIKALQPRLVVLNNIFRDQLDRYGEVNTVAAIWRQALQMLPADSTVALNADDPRVADLGKTVGRRVVYFGIEDASCALPSLPDAVDSSHCLTCSRPLVYDAVFAAHMGRYRCTTCGTERPRPQVRAVRVQLEADKPSHVRVATPDGDIELQPALPGLYNVYNALAATAAGWALQLPAAAMQAAVAEARAAFGRVERISAGERSIALFLVKNPAGFNEVLRTVFDGEQQRYALIAINDLLADGTDVSWLWDVDFEQIAGKLATATTCGLRAADMALRLKYAQAAPAQGPVTVETSIGAALTHALESTPAGQTLYVLPTYTAMLEIKNELARRGLAPRWQDD